MREILFRGKRVDNGEWLEGHPYVSSRVGISKIIYAFALAPEYNSDVSYYCEAYDVAPDTVSEFTGLCDKNGNRIYEGDLLKIISTVKGTGKAFHSKSRIDTAVVEHVMSTGGYRLKVYNNGKYKRISKFTQNHLWAYEAEVIGNKWDNKSLLENEQWNKKTLMIITQNIG